MQTLLGDEIDGAIDGVREGFLPCGEFEKADGGIGLEEDEQVQVAVVPEIVTECGAEGGKFQDMVGAAEFRDPFHREIMCEH